MKAKIGDRYGHLTVIGSAGIHYKKHRVECQCDCGRKVIKDDHLLRKQKSVYLKSCGEDTCSFSFIEDPNLSEKEKDKIRSKSRISDRERKKVIKIDIGLANQFILGR